MFTTRRGLLAPQNTFLDTVIRRCDGPTSCFLLSNAQILDFPIIYASAGFAKLMGFSRIEVLQKPARCAFLHGPQTNKDTLTLVDEALKEQRMEQFELILYTKTLTPKWILFRVVPIRDESDTVVLFLLMLRDISAHRQPLEADLAQNSALGAFAAASDAGSSWGKFARLVFSMVRQKSLTDGNRSGDEAEGTAMSTKLDRSGSRPEVTLETVSQKESTSEPGADQATIQKSEIVHLPRVNTETDLRLIEQGNPVAVTTDGTGGRKKHRMFAKVITPGKKIISMLSGDVNSLTSSNRRLASSRHDGMNKDGDEYGNINWASPETIPRYRPEPPCPPKHVLLHYSAFRVIWDWTILLLTGYTAIVVPLRLAIIPRPTWIQLRSNNRHPIRWTRSNIPESLAIVDAVIDIMFLLDIVINFHTSFVGAGGEVVAEPPVIRLNYLSGWFTLDLISCLPYEIIKYLWAANDNNIYNLLDGLRIIRLLRIGRAARRVDQYLEYVSTLLLLMILCFILLAHWFACAWYAVGVLDLENHIQYGWIPRYFNDSLKPQDWDSVISQGLPHFDNRSLAETQTNDSMKKDPPIVASGWLDDQVSDVHTSDSCCFDDETRKEISAFSEPMPLQTARDKWSAYVTALYFSLSLLTTIGFGNVAAFTESEKLLSICCMLIGALVYATIFGNITTIVQQLYATRTRYNEMMMGVKDFLRIHEVPRELGERVIDYITSSWSVNKGIDTAKVLNYCPKDMQADISVHLNRCVFNTHPAFRLASDGCRRSLAVNFQTLHTAPGDLIFHQGESVDQLCFIASGSLEVLQDEEVIAILGKGDVFGNPAWRTTTTVPSAASVRALTYCTLHMIRLERLRSVLHFYHAFSNSFTRNLEINHNLCNRVIFRKLADVKRELELSMRRTKDPPLSSLPASHPVRKLISRLRRPSQGGDLSSKYGLGTIPSGDSSLDGSELDSLSVSTDQADGSKTRNSLGPITKTVRPSEAESTQLASVTSSPILHEKADDKPTTIVELEETAPMNSNALAVNAHNSPGDAIPKKSIPPLNPAKKWARLISKAATSKPQAVSETTNPESKTDVQANSEDRPPVATAIPSEGSLNQPSATFSKLPASVDPSQAEKDIREGFKQLSTLFQQSLNTVHTDLKERIGHVVSRLESLEYHVGQIAQRLTVIESGSANQPRNKIRQLSNSGALPIVLQSPSFEQ